MEHLSVCVVSTHSEHGRNFTQEPTNEEKKLEKLQTKARSDLQTIHGIGCVIVPVTIRIPSLTGMYSPTKARQLVEAGCMKISDLEKPQYSEMLTNAMKIGFQFYRHIDQPVQRHESELATVSPT